MKTISWGILGCGGIAKKFDESMGAVEDGVVAACASRTPGKAEAFAADRGIGRWFDSYESMLARGDIDAVYVATTHNFHHENVQMCLDHGKAVLCEKPLAVTAAQAREMAGKAREKKLFLMEAMWTRFLPAVRQMKAWLEAGEIGEVRMMRADFCFRTGFDPQGRLFNPDLAGGALLDAGIYPVSMASYVMGGQPEEIRSMADIGSTGVDEQSAYLFRYAGGRMAMLSSAVRSASENRMEISGTEGRIVIPSHFLGARDVELHRNNGEIVKRRLPHTGARAFRYEIEAANRAIRNGRLECVEMPVDESVALAGTMDRIRAGF